MGGSFHSKKAVFLCKEAEGSQVNGSQLKSEMLLMGQKYFDFSLAGGLSRRHGRRRWRRLGRQGFFPRDWPGFQCQECRKYLKWEAHEKPLTDLDDNDIHPNFKKGNLNRDWAASHG